MQPVGLGNSRMLTNNLPGHWCQQFGETSRAEGRKESEDMNPGAEEEERRRAVGGRRG